VKKEKHNLNEGADKHEPLLEIKGLRTYFKTGAGDARAVDGVSFSILPGETYALVGESGCGKSVTALSILDLLQKPAARIEDGSILFEGRNIVNIPPVEMRKIRGNNISMIFQEPMTALNPVFTIGSQIAETIQLHQKVGKEEAARRTIKMIGAVGIPDAESRYGEYPHQMSGGMRQRVMIAMALACRPKLLIADEPTTALDVTIQAQILKLINDLQKETGTAVLLITHDMAVVRENADRIGVMYAGKIVEQAHVEELFSAPSHPYTRLLMRALPSRSRIGLKLETIEGSVPRATEITQGCRFANRCPAAIPECLSAIPPDVRIKESHIAACHLLKDGRAASALEIKRKPAPPSALEDGNVCLRIDDLKIHFPIRKGFFKRTVGHVKAVDGISLTLAKGETLAVVGESGCGKTTVGKGIVRLLDPTLGSIRFHSDDIAGLSGTRLKDMRKKIQFIFQDPYASLDPRMMIEETMLESMETHGIGSSRSDRIEKARKLLGQVGLHPDSISLYPHEFSGGQRQRIAIARALATEPEVIICDEATSALDVSVQAQILNLLKDLQSRLGLSYIFITHNLSVVEYLADRVAVMYLGRIVEEGLTEEIFSVPAHPYTAALLASAPKMAEDGPEPRKIAIEGDVPSPINPPSGCHFHTRCPKATKECSSAYPESRQLSNTHSCRCIFA